jgi:hypothetical protein
MRRIILFPVPFDKERFLARVKQCVGDLATA